MDAAYSSFIRPPTPDDAMSIYTNSQAMTAGDFELQIQNRIEPPDPLHPVHAHLWIGNRNMGSQALFTGNMWGDPNPQPMVRKGALIKIIIKWKHQTHDPIIFRANNGPENVSVFAAGGKLKIVHNGAPV
jgi:hypothetical protein